MYNPGYNQYIYIYVFVCRNNSKQLYICPNNPNYVIPILIDINILSPSSTASIKGVILYSIISFIYYITAIIKFNHL